MADCRFCKNNTRCNEYRGIRRMCKRSNYDSFEPVTHADRIRAMSDEELAKHLPWIFQQDICPKYDCSTEWVKEDCEKHLLDWLKQEVDSDPT